MGIQISPSLLSADFANLQAAAESVPNADWLHFDVMDNHFVPNLTFGAPGLEALAKVSEQPIDAHLMIENPDRWAPDFVAAGAKSVTFHVEAAHAPIRLAREIRAMGARAAMGLKQASNLLLAHPEIGKRLEGRQDRELFVPFGQRGYVIR